MGFWDFASKRPFAAFFIVSAIGGAIVGTVNAVFKR